MKLKFCIYHNTISSTHVVSGSHVGQHRCRIVFSVHKVLLNSASSEYSRNHVDTFLQSLRELSFIILSNYKKKIAGGYSTTNTHISFGKKKLL